MSSCLIIFYASVFTLFLDVTQTLHPLRGQEKKNEHTGRSSHKRQRFSPKGTLCLRQPKVENLLFFLVDALLPSVGQAGHKKSWQIFFCPSGLWLVIIFLSFGFRLEEIKGQRYKPFSLKGWARRPSISKTFFY